MEIVPVPQLSDNYAYLLTDGETGDAAVEITEKAIEDTHAALEVVPKTEKSGAALPTGGESAAKRAMDARQVRALRSSFVFIFYSTAT